MESPLNVYATCKRYVCTLFWKRQIHQLPKIWAPVWHVHCVLAFVFGRCENNRFSFFFFGFALKPFPFGILRRRNPQISHSKLLFLRNKCGCHQMLCLLGSEIHTAIPERNLSASRRKQPGHLNKLRLITKQTRAKKLKRWQMPEQTANAVKGNKSMGNICNAWANLMICMCPHVQFSSVTTCVAPKQV